MVNARISDRSWPRYLRLRRLWKPFLSRIARILAQSETDAERLRALGCAPERVTVAGNLKFDVRAAQSRPRPRGCCARRARDCDLWWPAARSKAKKRRCSKLWPRLLAADPALVLVLAPRHPERFAAVAALLQRSGLIWSRRSEWTGSLRAGQIVLLDTIGELASVYSLAAVAFVGGSLVPAGGHNPLEPAQFAVPIVMGPHYANFRAITEDLLAHQALRIAAKEDLALTLIDLLQNRSRCRGHGQPRKAGLRPDRPARQRVALRFCARCFSPPRSAAHERRLFASHPASARHAALSLGLGVREASLHAGREPIRRLRWPVVSIGNLSTGGAGKTPLTIALAQGAHRAAVSM